MRSKPLEYQFEVTRFRMLTPTVFELAFLPVEPEARSLPFEGGQFVSIVVPGAGPAGRDLRRAYSIASAPEKSPIELCVKLVEGGPGTNYLFRLRPGDRLRGFAPYGDFTYRPRTDRHACFISTGTGIAPFRSMIQSADYSRNPPRSATLLLGVRDEAEVLYDQEFGKTPGLEWVPAVSRPSTGAWSGFQGRVTDYLRSRGDGFPWLETEYYLCGGGAMIDEVKALLAERGVEKAAIHQEIYYKTPKSTA
jgi:ferredoxin-NADP reductase